MTVTIPCRVLLVLAPLLAACSGEEDPHNVARLREHGAAAQADGQRIGSLLHDRGLIQNPDVFARAREAALASQRGTAAGDSAGRTFRIWLDDWVDKNPDRVAEAEGVHPLALTPEQEAEQRLQMELAHRHGTVKTMGTPGRAAPR